MKRDDGVRPPGAASVWPGAQLARWMLTSFLGTFMAARCLVFLIMSRRTSDLYVHVGGTHIHHLNFGIFLLAGVGAYLILARRNERRMIPLAVVYGIGLALTFDEFGMWLHLGGGYWQRASLDAVAVIAGMLGLVVVAPRLRQFRPHHWGVTIGLGVTAAIFGWLLIDSFQHVGRAVGPGLEMLERTGPP